MLSACSTVPEIIYRTKEVYIYPPLKALPKIEPIPFNGKTNLDLLNWSFELEGRLNQCIDDREVVRKWQNQQLPAKQ